MVDQLARMRQIVGTPAAWAAHNLVLGDGEIALERVNAGTVRAKIGDGSRPFSEAPYLGSDLDIAAADLRYVQQANTVTLGGVAAANKWPRLGANGKLDPSLLQLPAAFTLRGTADPTQPPPAGSVAGDVWVVSPGGVVDGSWGAPVAGQTAAEGELLILGTGGVWALISSPFDLDGVVLETDLAGPGGATMVGTASGATVEERLAANDDEFADVEQALAIRAAIVDYRADLAAFNPNESTVVFLKEAGRRGLFTYNPLPAPADPLQGLTVPSTLTGHWEREWNKIVGHPEWFGAVTGGPDCLAALAACNSMCPVTQLAGGRYQISDTWHVLPYRAVYGIGTKSSEDAPDDNSYSAIQLDHPTKPVLFAGVEVFPGDPETTFPSKLHWRGFEVRRGVAPTLTPDTLNNPCGVRAKHIVHGLFEDIVVRNGGNDWYCGAVVYSFFEHCGCRSNDHANGDASRPYAVGWMLDGTLDVGFAGGNASIEINDCFSVVGRVRVNPLTAPPADLIKPPCAMVLYGASVDTFVRNFEVAKTSKGVIVYAQGEANPWALHDILLDHLVLDQVDFVGVEINGTGIPLIAIDIPFPYIASSDVNCGWGLLINGQVGDANLASGSIGVVGGQIIGAFGASAIRGIYTQGVSITRTVIENYTTTACWFSNSYAVDLTPKINSKGVTAPLSAAIWLENCQHSFTRPTIFGNAGTLYGGVAVTGGHKNEIVAGALTNEACFQGGAANRTVVYQALPADPLLSVNPGLFGAGNDMVYRGIA